MNRRQFLSMVAAAPMLRLLPAPAQRINWNDFVKIDQLSLPSQADVAEMMRSLGPSVPMSVAMTFGKLSDSDLLADFTPQPSRSI